MSLCDGCSRLGAAIVVETGTVLPFFTENYYNPLCFIQYQNPLLPPVAWDKVYLLSKQFYFYCTHNHLQVSMKFAGNRALIGSAVYANRINLCSWYSYEAPYFYTDSSDVLRWPFVSYGYVLCYDKKT